MYKNQSVAVVIPAHNEERFVGSVIRSMPSLVDYVVVVDDCSTDNTAAVAREVSDPRVHLVQTAKNSGVGGAMKTGYRKALELGPGIIVKMDGDGQMSAGDL